MRRRQRSAGNMEEGQDSFLDVISNMVGILIILVMIAGVRAANSGPEDGETPDAAEETLVAAPLDEEASLPERELSEDVIAETEDAETAEEPLYVDAETLRDIEEQGRRFLDRETANAELRLRIEETAALCDRVRRSIEERKHEQAALIDMYSTIKAAMEVHEEDKDDADREVHRLKTQLATAEVRLEELRRQQKLLAEIRPKSTVIENRPTPLGRVVEDKEVHFRLKKGRLSYVPFDSLYEKIRIEVGVKRSEYFRHPVSTGVVGPIDGYRARYRVVVRDVRAAEGLSKRLDLDYAEFAPLAEEAGQVVGETMDEALRDHSNLMQRLSRYRQDIYTVTVWVYPDSFEDFQSLKQYLYQRGYKVAARPLAKDHPISASPQGTRSRAQ